MGALFHRLKQRPFYMHKAGITKCNVRIKKRHFTKLEISDILTLTKGISL